MEQLGVRHGLGPNLALIAAFECFRWPSKAWQRTSIVAMRSMRSVAFAPVAAVLLSAGPYGCGGGDNDLGSRDFGDQNAGPGSDSGGQRGNLVGQVSTVLLGPEGATLEHDGILLEFPAGAVSEVVEVSAQTLSVSPTGYQLYSPVYEFLPEGLAFQQPVEVQIPFDGDKRLAALFWSRGGASEAFERLGGVPGESRLAASITHFSRGFVANGVDYSDPPNVSCSVTRNLDVRSVQPSGVAVFFTTEDCQGRPISSLQISDLEVLENDVAASVEASPSLLSRDGLQVFVTLMLDLSTSSQANLQLILDGARAFISRLQVTEQLPVQIAVEVFAGESQTTVLQTPTLDTIQLLEALDQLELSNGMYPGRDAGSTNLYGAVGSGLSNLATSRAAFEDRNAGGAFTSGYLVIFTDGRDTASADPNAARQQSLAAVGLAEDQVLVVGLQSPDFDLSYLVDLAGPGLFSSPQPGTLRREFEALAQRIAGQVSSTYLLGYCSPRRGGVHSVGVRLVASTDPESVVDSAAFSADGFGPGCSPTLFEEACQDLECGGLGCGACNDRTSLCSAGLCVSFCESDQRCGDDVFMNPLGYQQLCPDVPPSRITCDEEDACVDTLQDNRHCGGCNAPCAPGQNCSGGSCEAIICNEGEYVQSNNCTACPDFSFSEAGADASGADTTCTCPRDFFVRDNTCQLCPPDSSGFGGAVPGPDTSCVDQCSSAVGTLCGDFDEAYLKAQAPQANATFGREVAIDNDTLAVASNQAVEIFERSNGVWLRRQRIDFPLARTIGAVGLSGDTLAVGEAEPVSPSSGSFLNILRRVNGTWITEFRQRVVEERNGGAIAVAPNGSLVAVGDAAESSGAAGINGPGRFTPGASDSGAVTVYVRGPNGWSEEAHIKGSFPDRGDLFGWSIQLTNDRLFVGSPFNDARPGSPESDNSELDIGAVFVYERNNGSWALDTIVHPLATQPAQGFGTAVAVSGTELAVGAERRSGPFRAGAVYVFDRVGASWVQEVVLAPPELDESDFMGISSLGFDGNVIVAGAPRDDTDLQGSLVGLATNNDLNDSGGVYIFSRGHSWQQVSTVLTKAASPDLFDGFGFSVDVSGPNVAIGAANEDGGEESYGNQMDNSARDAGAVFVRRIVP